MNPRPGVPVSHAPVSLSSWTKTCQGIAGHQNGRGPGRLSSKTDGRIFAVHFSDDLGVREGAADSGLGASPVMLQGVWGGLRGGGGGIPPSNGEHVRTPGGTNRQTNSALMADPPPPRRQRPPRPPRQRNTKCHRSAFRVLSLYQTPPPHARPCR